MHETSNHTCGNVTLDGYDHEFEYFLALFALLQNTAYSGKIGGTCDWFAESSLHNFIMPMFIAFLKLSFLFHQLAILLANSEMGLILSVICRMTSVKIEFANNILAGFYQVFLFHLFKRDFHR